MMKGMYFLLGDGKCRRYPDYGMRAWALDPQPVHHVVSFTVWNVFGFGRYTEVTGAIGWKERTYLLTVQTPQSWRDADVLVNQMMLAEGWISPVFYVDNGTQPYRAKGERYRVLLGRVFPYSTRHLITDDGY